VFGFAFAVNSSVHSYLILAYAGSEKAAEDVGFYYAANALGRFFGHAAVGLAVPVGRFAVLSDVSLLSNLRSPVMSKNVMNVLFICTHNSARSIIAEALLNQLGGGRFRGYSAGSTPSGTVNPKAIELLERNRYRVSELRSKDWAEFAAPGAPEMDFVLTVCDKAAGEVCPVWPGQPLSAHWGVPDPAAVQGTAAEIDHAFTDAFLVLQRRVSLFLNLPFEKLERLSLLKELQGIGTSRHD
jgi:arsenate reductase